MDDQTAEKLRYTLQTTGWTEVLQPMLQQRLAGYHGLLISDPQQRTAGYIEALMFVLAWPYQQLAQNDHDRTAQPVKEPEPLGDPYREPVSS